MTTERRLTNDLPDILGELATAPYPEYIDDVLATTAEVRQRPAWTFPERWLPMVDTMQPVLVPRFPWRSLSMVLLLITLLLATVVALLVGAQQRRPAPPFGPARNGLIAYEVGGDIFAADPATGTTTAIVKGPDTDVAPRFSPDGTHFSFERRLGDDKAQVYVARPDGSELRLVTPEPVSFASSGSWRNYEFSPDGESILLITSDRGRPSISIAPLDGGPLRTIDVGMAVQIASFRPTAASEILFVGGNENKIRVVSPGLFVVDTVSGAVRTIVKPKIDVGLTGASWSPDGSRILYWSWDSSLEATGATARTHVVNADGTGDRELPLAPGEVWNAVAAWSNDGTRIFLVRGYTGGQEDVRPAVLPADGTDAGFEIPYEGTAEAGCCSIWTWSPDDSKILGRSADPSNQPLSQMIIDLVRRESHAAPWTSTSDPAWQRRAP